jgi:hypothetical protein
MRESCLRSQIPYAQAFGARNLQAIVERELPLLGMVR